MDLHLHTLPSGERAIVDIDKLTADGLHSKHPRGRHKARVFASVGIRPEDADDLREALLRGTGNSEAQQGFRLPTGTGMSPILIWSASCELKKISRA